MFTRLSRAFGVLLGRRQNLPTIATRAAVVFIGAFGLTNLVGDRLRPGFDANLWWVDWRPLGSFLGPLLIAVACGLLLASAVRPGMRPWRLWLTRLTTASLLLLALIDSARFYRLLIDGQIRSTFPLPFSLLVMAGLTWALLSLRRRPPGQAPAPKASLLRQAAFAAIGLVYLGAFALGQIYCFGKTDYRGPADVIVVFGAKVRPDGSCSDALSDRVKAACRLYREGLAPRILMSGGQGDSPVHEVDAMKALAVRLGVPADAILLDRDGLDTQRSVRNTAAMFRDLRIRPGRVLAVSHFYHLPRIKMAYQRAGWDVRTVPAPESYPLKALPYFVAREVAALWAYYLRPLAE